jgi:8'-apo-carotenoid 13,14-cleaving dioxygenase
LLDVCAYRNMFAGEGNQGPDTTDSRFERWIIDPARKSVERRFLDSEPQEFPRFDERLTGKPYRFAYTLAEADHSNGALLGDTRLYKYDLVSGTKQTRNFGPERHPGEFIFVPKSPDAAEDEGWLMGFVIEMANDAQDFEGTPQAIVHIPHRVPAGFHGNWIAG